MLKHEKMCLACKEDEYCYHDVTEKFALDCVASFDDPDSSYTFDQFKVFKRQSDGALFWGTDSGCSCPTPFEDVKSVDDLNAITPNGWEAFKTAFENYGNQRSEPYDDDYRKKIGPRWVETHIQVETLDKIRAMLYKKVEATK